MTNKEFSKDSTFKFLHGLANIFYSRYKEENHDLEKFSSTKTSWVASFSLNISQLMVFNSYFLN